jgi:hypothetical protein
MQINDPHDGFVVSAVEFGRAFDAAQQLPPSVM